MSQAVTDADLNSARHLMTSLSIRLDRVESSCRSFNLPARPSRFLESDERCIYAFPCRLADTFGLALELLNSTPRCSSFLPELLEQLHNFPRRLICTKYHAPHLLKMWSSFHCTYSPQNLIIQYYIHWLTKTKIPREKAWEERRQHRVLHYYGLLHCGGSDSI